MGWIMVPATWVGRCLVLWRLDAPEKDTREVRQECLGSGGAPSSRQRGGRLGSLWRGDQEGGQCLKCKSIK